ncbi:MAG: hypothetical protein MJ025_00560 [Victivallaceae bacterium]|nr:hypothetical protein [Victivallaceae bacterium]
MTAEDVERIGSFLGIGAERFANTMARLSSDRRQLVLDGDEDAPCIFLEFDGGVASCAIDPVKPEQCRNFPEKWNYPGWRKECMGK